MLFKYTVYYEKIGSILGLFFLECGTIEAQECDFRDTTKAVELRGNNLVCRMSLEEKIDLLAGYEDFYLHPCECLGIPAFRMSDGPLGVASWGIWGRVTAFPAALSLAASWNRDLAAELVVSFIQQVQKGGVIATVKHFAANDQEFDRYSVSSEVSERALREIYLPAFQAAVQKAGTWAVITGYNPVNGVYNTQNKHLIDILKKEWGFKGMLMSDWACTYSAFDAALNDLDLEMGSKSCFNRAVLLPLVKEGKVSEEVINDKVRRIYRACLAMRFFDRAQESGEPVFNPDANKMALEMAQEGLILLKNDRHFLPLDKDKVKTIAVIGPTANPSFISDRIFKNDRIETSRRSS